MRAPYPPKAAFISKGGVKSMRATPACRGEALDAKAGTPARSIQVAPKTPSRLDKNMRITPGLLAEGGLRCQDNR
jgi:hypothetical protein